MDLSNALSPSSIGLSSVTSSPTPTPSNVTNAVGAAIPSSFSALSSANSATMSPANSEAADNSIPNLLSSYASYTALWTLAALTPEEANDSSLYRSKSSLDNIVFSSAGRFDSKRIGTNSGKPEFFLNNLVMKQVIAPSTAVGVSDACSIDFDIHEPYSLGEFIQSLYVAAVNAGYTSAVECVYVLKLEFSGYDENGQAAVNPIAPKYYCVNITKVDFTANEGGCIYKVQSAINNSLMLGDIGITLYKDIKLLPGTLGNVQEIISGKYEGSLISALNAIELEELKNNKKKVPDEWEINFPTIQPAGSSTSNSSGRSATMDVNSISQNRSVGTNASSSGDSESNPIGLSSLNLNVDTGGNQKFASYLKATDPNGHIDQSKITIDPSAKVLQFAKGLKITDVITQIIIHSQYAIDAATNTSKYVNGKIPYFKIIPRTEYLKLDPSTSRYAKKYILDIVQYYVPEAKNSNATAVSDLSKIKSQIVKKYNYIYTGGNSEVLKFNIEFNNMYNRTVSQSPEHKNSQNEAELHGSTVPENQSTAVASTKPAVAAVSQIPNAIPSKNPYLINEMTNPSGSTNAKTKVAQVFHNNMIDEKEMTKIDLEILGDPYWMCQFGGNYVSRADPDKLINSDGEMNYTVSSVIIELNFFSPIDINEGTGLYTFPTGKLRKTFSGLYTITKADTIFMDGVFKQKLQGSRMAGQPEDYSTNNTPPVGIKQDNILVELGKLLKPTPFVFDVDPAVGLSTSNPSTPSTSSSPATPLTSTTTA